MKIAKRMDGAKTRKWIDGRDMSKTLTKTATLERALYYSDSTRRSAGSGEP